MTSEGPLAESILRGAEFGLSEAEVFAKMFGQRVELLARTAVSDAQAFTTARALFREEQVVAVIGGASDGAAEALQKAAAEASKLFLNVGATASRLRREQLERRALHVHPSVATLVTAAGLWLIEQGRRGRWGLLFAESAFGADVEAAASALAANGSAQILSRERVPPAFDDWPAVLRRLREAQVDAVILGLERSGTQAFLGHYRDSGLSNELAGLTPDPHFALDAEPARLAGIWPLVWHKSLERYSARELNGRFTRRFARPFDGAAWAAWAAVKLVTEAAVRGGSTAVQPILDFLKSRLAFDGHKGAALGFREADHELAQPIYIARPRSDASSGEAGVLEIAGEVSREKLDVVARPKQERK